MREIDKTNCTRPEDLPVLVLAVHNEYQFERGRTWLHIAHQTGGNACHQRYMVGTILKPREKVGNGIIKLDKQFYKSNTGFIIEPSLEEINRYSSWLNNLLKVDCNTSFRELEEAIYPVDCTSENVKQLTSERLPQDLDDLIRLKKEERPLINRWHLYILGRNSD